MSAVIGVSAVIMTGALGLGVPSAQAVAVFTPVPAGPIWTAGKSP